MLDKFKDWLIINCDSSRTVKTYYAQMKHFFTIYEEYTQDNINLYLKKLIEENKSNSSFNQFLTACFKYSTFSNITVNLPKQRDLNQKIKPYLSEKQFIEIFNKIPYITPSFEKWQSIILILYYCGLRKNELVNLTRQDIDFEKLVIHVRNTKGKIDRDVFLTKNIIKYLNRYFLCEIEDENAFNITEGIVNYICSTIKQHMGLEIFYPHLLRDACCRNWLEKGIPIHRVKTLMGHKNITTTALYCNASSQEAEESFRKCIKPKI